MVPKDSKKYIIELDEKLYSKMYYSFTPILDNKLASQVPVVYIYAPSYSQKSCQGTVGVFCVLNPRLRRAISLDAISVSC